MTDTLAVEIIRDPANLSSLLPAWWALWRRCPATTPFQSPAWLLPWWHAFAPGPLRVVAAHAGQRLVGLAPFYLEVGPFGRRLLPLGIGISDYLDVLADPAVRHVGAALSSHVAGIASEWDVCEIPETPPDGSARQLTCPSGCDDVLEPASVCPVLALPETVAGLRRALPPNQRQNLLTAHNRIGRRGEAVVVCADRASAPALLAALVRLHAARWESRGEPGVLADPRVLAFHQQAAPLLLEAGLLRLYALRIAGEIVAAYYGFLDRDRAYVYLTGFDPRYRFESPGTVIIGHAVEQAVAEGAREFHFLRGGEAYKYAWGARDRRNWRRVFRHREEVLPNLTHVEDLGHAARVDTRA